MKKCFPGAMLWYNFRNVLVLSFSGLNQKDKTEEVDSIKNTLQELHAEYCRHIGIASNKANFLAEKY